LNLIRVMPAKGRKLLRKSALKPCDRIDCRGSCVAAVPGPHPEEAAQQPSRRAHDGAAGIGFGIAEAPLFTQDRRSRNRVIIMSVSDLFPAIEPYNSGFLEVSKLHTIYYEEAGNKAGVPALFLHGGPGGGLTPDYRRFFDPAHYRVVLLDQRGAALRFDGVLACDHKNKKPCRRDVAAWPDLAPFAGMTRIRFNGRRRWPPSQPLGGTPVAGSADPASVTHPAGGP